MAKIPLKNELRSKIRVAIAGAFAFVIALSWNEFIKDAVLKIVEVAGLTGSGYLVRLAAALVTTVVCVIGIHFASKL